MFVSFPKRTASHKNLARLFQALFQALAAVILTACGTFAQPQPAPHANVPASVPSSTPTQPIQASPTGASGAGGAGSAGVPQTGQGTSGSTATATSQAAAVETPATTAAGPTATATAASATAATAAASPTPAAAATTASAPAASAPAAAAPGAGHATFLSFGPVNRDPNQAAQSPGLAIGTTQAGGQPDLWVTWAENGPGNVRQIFASERVTAGQPGTGSFQPRGASINIHANVIGDIPTITFAGANRTVPWDAWQEPSPGFGNIMQIFASRFNLTTGLWQQVGQNRGDSEASINLQTRRQTSQPFIFNGTADTTKPPVAWVTWLEQSNVSNAIQIYASKAVQDDKAIGGFHWQPVGQVDAFNEPTLNVDRARNSDHPVGVFAETGATVPWVTWYEDGNNRPARIFTVRGVVDDKKPGGFRWINVPPCKFDEISCALNINPLRDAEDPSMAAGSLNPGEAPVPWIAWSEDGPTGSSQIFVSRLDLNTRNDFLQVGGSLNVDQTHNAHAPIITFVKNVPYVAWLEDDSTGKSVIQVRHLSSDPQTGNWTLDTPSNGFSNTPALPVTGLAAAGADDGLYLAWVEGDPTKIASHVVVGELKP